MHSKASSSAQGINNQHITLSSVWQLTVHFKCEVAGLKRDNIHTRFCSHSPLNCWNFWDIRSWALPIALRTFPSTTVRGQKKSTQHGFKALFFRCIITDDVTFCNTITWKNESSVLLNSRCLNFPVWQDPRDGMNKIKVEKAILFLGHYTAFHLTWMQLVTCYISMFAESN